MKRTGLTDYLDHIRKAADACAFVEGMSEAGFLADKRTHNAVIMSLIIVGEAATKVMDRFPHLRYAILRCRSAVAGDAQSDYPWLF
jgi:uncharacterized protein with HEPN domain